MSNTEKKYDAEAVDAILDKLAPISKDRFKEYWDEILCKPLSKAVKDETELAEWEAFALMMFNAGFIYAVFEAGDMFNNAMVKAEQEQQEQQQ